MDRYFLIWIVQRIKAKMTTQYLIAAMLCISEIAVAQQRPQYTQYVLNNFLLNPALSGIENYTDIKVGYRQQWTGLQDAPKTSFASANWALGDAYLWPNALSFEEEGNDPRARSLLQHYTASPAHHGVGISLFSDKAGQLTTQNLSLSYAYHLQLGNELNLSAGVAAGINRIGIDVNSLLLEVSNDPALAGINKTSLRPDLSAGLWLYGAKFYAGLSAQQLLPQRVLETSNGKMIPHFFLTSGYKLYLDDNLHVLPSVMLKGVAGAPISMDANVKMGFKDRAWIGMGLRNSNALNVMAGFNVSHLINLSYSYDFTTSQLASVDNGSHEFVLGILLNNVYRVFCPQRMW